MENSKKITVKKGQRIPITFEGREFEVIVIDPDGIGKGQPSVGFGFRMMERYAGLPNDTLSRWVTEESVLAGAEQKAKKMLKPPSGNTFGVLEIKGEDGNNYVVVEATDWFDLAFDVLEKPGRIANSVKTKLLAFVKWFAIKGFYAEAYTALKGVYTSKDSRTLSAWLEARFCGIPKRNKYTDFLQVQGCIGYDYAYWTDYVYLGLFGKRAFEMKKFWKLMEGDKNIGRNYIPEVEGLNAVTYCESMTIELFVDNLQQAHDDAISYAKRKYFSGSLASY